MARIKPGAHLNLLLASLSSRQPCRPWLSLREAGERSMEVHEVGRPATEQAARVHG